MSLKSYNVDSISCKNHADKTLKSYEVVEIEDEKYSKIDCFKKCLELNIENDVAWNNLGEELNSDDKINITVLNIKLSKLDCFKKCLQYNDENYKAWNNLGIELKANQTVEIMG